MKANEAPEKIYVQLPSRKWIGRTWDEIPIKEGDNPNWKNATNIEYVRKDTFIEKAAGWLSDNTLSGLCLDFGNVEIVREFVDNFRNAMKL